MPKGIPASGKRKVAGKRGRPKGYAVPVRGRKASTKKASFRKATAKRSPGRPRKTDGQVTDLMIKLDKLADQVGVLVEMQKAAYIDQYRQFFLNTQNEPAEFMDKFPRMTQTLGIEARELEAAVAEFKEPEVTTTDNVAFEGQSAEEGDTVQKPHDDLNII